MKSGSFQKYYRDKIDDVDINENASDAESFQHKTEIVRELPDRSPQLQNSGHADQPAQPSASFLNAKVTVPLKYLSNFWTSLDLALMNCEVKLDLSWTEDCILIAHDNKITGVNFLTALIDYYNEYYF